ncbi:Grx4 family monothiol glutaredoxin [Basilea psittacipulmonis]|uniref:Glutaredoxin n=1 Tax=Basilea psittacipulmonis DSM 24701 TaxID=1072685 RepID=A0A077DFX3_9BURK|nr:Grx4 family monothiol glutaredoxin [Basilea psittacipulmonis]AIL32073.1 glutaredoxin [Basilea psittacipulmonis DSM 24701]
MSDTQNVQDWIKEIVTGHNVVLFMKGAASMPQCGFSKRAVEILRDLGVTKLVTVNILEDQELRAAVKEYSNWPTYPQLYVKGEFIGGVDIMNEMAESGELKPLLEEAGAMDA